MNALNVVWSDIYILQTIIQQELQKLTKISKSKKNKNKKGNCINVIVCVYEDKKNSKYMSQKIL